MFQGIKLAAHVARVCTFAFCLDSMTCSCSSSGFSALSATATSSSASCARVTLKLTRLQWRTTSKGKRGARSRVLMYSRNLQGSSSSKEVC